MRSHSSLGGNETIKHIIGIAVATILVATLLVPICQSSADDSDMLEMWIITGQSNATTEYSNDSTIVNQDVGAPHYSCLYYGGDLPPRYYFYNLDHDIVDYWSIKSLYDNGAWKFGGLCPSLSYGISNYTHHDVLMIEASLPGAPISTINVNGWEFAQDCINDALTKIPDKYKTVVKGGVVLLQGEANTSTNIDTYKEGLDTLKDHYNSIGFDSIYVVQTNPEDGVNSSIAQVEWCEETPGAYLASTLPATFTIENGMLNPDDGVHYTQKAIDLIGKDVSKSISEHYPISHESNPYNSLLMVIPLIVIIAILLAAIPFIKRET